MATTADNNTPANDPLAIFGDPAAATSSRADSPEPGTSKSSAAVNPFDPLSPASKAKDSEDAPKKAAGGGGENDLLSQIMDWGAKNQEEEDDREQDSNKESKGDGGKDAEAAAAAAINPNVMAVRDDSESSAIESLMSDEDIKKIQGELEATHLAADEK